jgi:hypothetical protein
VLGFVEEVDVVVPITGGRCEWEYGREGVVRLLERFPNLTKLYIRTGEALTEGLVGEVHDILTDPCGVGLGGKTLNNYWWWYSIKSQDRARISRDKDPALMSQCRLVELFGKSKRRLRLISSYPDNQRRHMSQHTSSSSRLTYLFLLD